MLRLGIDPYWKPKRGGLLVSEKRRYGQGYVWMLFNIRSDSV